MSLPDVVIYRINDYPDGLWAIPNNRSARFNSDGIGATQYFSFHPLGTYPELLRDLERPLGRALRENDPEITEFKRSLWAFRADLDEVFDLTFDSCGVLGLTPADLVDDDHAACRRAGDAYGHGDPQFPSIWRYPSASLPGVTNLVMFGAKAVVSYDGQTVSAADLPGTVAASAAKVPLELMPHMRHIGEIHASYEARLRGQEHVFDQPTTFRVRT